MISAEKIFAVRSDAEFDEAALELFRFQAERCAPYAEYLRLLGVNPQEIGCADDIPFMPIELFKTHDIYCGGDAPQIVFTSSATTGMTPSRHPVADLAIYERDFTESFRLFYGEPSQWSIYGLLPNYLQRSGSSLVYMVDRLIRECGSGGFYLDEYERLIDDMARDPKPKILLGVSYALWDLAERHAPRLENTVVMETGGMKGHRRELPKAEFHKILCDAFGVAEIHSEYGMAELMSQAYSSGGGVFFAPPWMRVRIRDINDPFAHLPVGRRGAIDIIDLGNVYSCAFIATQDVGVCRPDGGFVVEGRVSNSDIRGCNLLVQ